MSEALFFPEKPDEPVDVHHYEVEVSQAHKNMHLFLHSKVGNGETKTKLHDQLIWLRYQILYFTYSQDIDHLLENYNWVVSNFNHDLSLPEDERFKLIDE